MPKPTSDCRATERKHPWPMVRLGDVCEFSRGLTYSKSDEVQDSLNVVLRSNNVDLETGRLVLDELKYIRDSIEIPTSKRVSKGAILMCTANGSKQHLGKVALIDGDYGYAFGGFMGLLTPNDSIDSRYLYWQLMSFEFKRLVTTLTDGANINNLKFTDISQFTFPLPPLSEQKEIVARLERELAAVEKMKKGFEALAETAKAEFKAELKEVFEELKHRGTETRKLGEVCECKKGPFGSALTKSMFVPRSDSAVKVYEQKNAIRKDATLGSYYITRQYFDAKMHSFEVKPTDIIISCAGTIGATYILPLGCEQGVINQALMRVRTGLCLDRLFFLYFFETILNAVNDSSNGSAMKNIPPFKIFKAFEIPVPSLAEQREVVARLDGAKARTEKLEAKAREGVAVCETIRKAILKEAFAPCGAGEVA